MHLTEWSSLLWWVQCYYKEGWSLENKTWDNFFFSLKVTVWEKQSSKVNSNLSHNISLWLLLYCYTPWILITLTGTKEKKRRVSVKFVNHTLLEIRKVFSTLLEWCESWESKTSHMCLARLTISDCEVQSARFTSLSFSSNHLNICGWRIVSSRQRPLWSGQKCCIAG